VAPNAIFLYSTLFIGRVVSSKKPNIGPKSGHSWIGIVVSSAFKLVADSDVIGIVSGVYRSNSMSPSQLPYEVQQTKASVTSHFSPVGGSRSNLGTESTEVRISPVHKLLCTNGCTTELTG
jgi:hypothetical protein